MSRETHNSSTMQKYKACNMHCMRDFKDLKEQKQLCCEPPCQKDTKEGDTESQGVVIDGDPTQLSFIVCLKRQTDPWV